MFRHVEGLAKGEGPLGPALSSALNPGSSLSSPGKYLRVSSNDGVAVTLLVFAFSVCFFSGILKSYLDLGRLTVIENEVAAPVFNFSFGMISAASLWFWLGLAGALSIPLSGYSPVKESAAGEYIGFGQQGDHLNPKIGVMYSRRLL